MTQGALSSLLQSSGEGLSKIAHEYAAQFCNLLSPAHYQWQLGQMNAGSLKILTNREVIARNYEWEYA